MVSPHRVNSNLVFVHIIHTSHFLGCEQLVLFHLVYSSKSDFDLLPDQLPMLLSFLANPQTGKLAQCVLEEKLILFD